MLASIFFIIVAILFMISIISKVKKKKFFERDSFLWMLGSIVVLILAIFPNLIIYLSNLIGIEYAPSLLFLVAIVFILHLLFRQNEQVSLLKEQVKDLGQRVVILEKIIDENRIK
ncbi:MULTISPECIES: DUF2304 domain-containing protein [Clostridium]|uniref:DUF2304 domain-containing protein n=1 Tax=Clostridium cibarium TaxID=2762247 RepID=A0ABR8PQ21_9CLOT|nr:MULTISPECIES: DUF2304 domain-containing protein [Clostridium]MBD7910225.1 DUF2304 domain-containing protein [Clostridium cibarium]